MAAKPRYLLGPAADAFLLGPGATLLVTAAILTLNGVGASGAATLVTIVLSICLVGPHYAATLQRAYSSREIIRAHPWVTLAVPPLLFAAAVLAVRHPTTIGLAYFGAYVLWSGYHYSGQSLGLFMLYPLRQGARLAPLEKRLCSLPLYVSWLLSVLGLFRLSGSARNAAYQTVRNAWHGPPLPTWATVVALGALCASFGGLVTVARSRRARGVPLPWPSYAVLSTQVLWFTIGLFHPFFNITLVPIFHGLQYLSLTSWHACHGHGAAGPRRFAGYLLLTLLLGMGITPGLFALVGGGNSPQEALVLSAAVVTFVNLHHFLLDGRIWRMRERRVVQSMVT